MNEVTVLYFCADWCEPCNQLKPLILDYCERKGVNLRVLNVENFESEVRGRRIKSLPTTVIINSLGEELIRLQGNIRIADLDNRLSDFCVRVTV